VHESVRELNELRSRLARVVYESHQTAEQLCVDTWSPLAAGAGSCTHDELVARVGHPLLIRSLFSASVVARLDVLNEVLSVISSVAATALSCFVFLLHLRDGVGNSASVHINVDDSTPKYHTERGKCVCELMLCLENLTLCDENADGQHCTLPSNRSSNELRTGASAATATDGQ
jgi:hypothetical protein